MDRFNYLDFEVKIEREGEEYLARVLRSPVGEASCRFTVPFSEDRLALLTLKLSRPRAMTRSARPDEIATARELGGGLFESVFAGEVRARLRSSLDEASRQEQTGLRLKLRLQDVPELADLPWEFLFDPSLDRFLAQSNRTPIVRYLELPERIRPLAVDLPLQILVMLSSPLDPDYPRLDIEREEGMLRRALQPLSLAGKVQVDWLEDATLANLQRRLRGGRYHVLHFIGHGGFDESTGEGVLVLHDDQSRGWRAGAHRIATLLHDHPSLRLAVLNACEGARNSRRDPFAGVATTLIRHGIPAVVAMQFEITDRAAITFAGEFYTALAEGYPVDAAVAEARKAVYAQPNDVEWATPVLYTRAPDGVLFDVRSAPRPQDLRAEQPEPAQVPPPVPARDAPVVPVPRPEPRPSAVPPIRPGGTVRRPRILEGHTKEVHGVAFSPDGTILASASGGTFILGARPVRLWRVAEGTVVRSLDGHTQGVLSVAFSPDGILLASGAHDNTARIWDATEGRHLRTLQGHTNSVTVVRFSPDGRMLASGSWDNTVRLWRIAEDVALPLQGHRGFVRDLVFSRDGTTLISASSDGTLRVWDVVTQKLIDILEGHKRAVTSAALSPDGAILASGSDDETILLWDAHSREVFNRLEGHKDSVRSLAFSPDGALLASGAGDDLLGDDFSIRLWTIPDGRLLTTLEGHKHAVHSLDFSPDGALLASGSWDRTIRLWDVRAVREADAPHG